MARVVTVSATYGARGPVIAPALAERLGLPFADRLIQVQGRTPPPSEEGVTDAELEEEPPSPLLESLAMLSAGWALPMPTEPAGLPEQLKTQVEESIRELIDSGGAVILGRAGAAALAGHRNVFHVRFDGPEERRAEIGAAAEGISLKEAKHHLADTDSTRARYVKRLYRRDPSDPSLYHLVVDTTVLPPEVVTELVATAAEAFWSQ